MISKKSFLINRHLPREKVQLEAITVMTLPSHVFALVLRACLDGARVSLTKTGARQLFGEAFCRRCFAQELAEK
jgi:hypothetical protein